MKRDAAVLQNRYAVPGLDRGLRILQLFDRRQTRLGAPEVAKALGIPRTTVFRLMQTLEHLGFLERDDRQFRLGPAVLRLGFEYLASLELTELARPLLERLRDATGFSAQLVIRDACDVVVVLKSAAPSSFASSVNVGTRLPAHATILGRTMLADLTEAELKALYGESRLPAASRNAPQTLAELRRMLADDRVCGYTMSESLYENGISGVAAPVRDQSGRVAAAISVVVPRATLDPKALRDSLVQQVLATAATLSHRLNYRPAVAA